MSSPRRETVKTRYDAVLARERRHARALAFAVFESKPFSVWEVLFVPILVMTYMNQRRLRDHFVDNYLFTKTLALAGALDVARGDRTREAVDARIEADTVRVLEQAPGDVYTEEIRLAQLEEIQVLLEHDLRLLAADGEDYDALVRRAYRGRREYETYVDDLAAAERRVSDAAVRTLGSRAAPDMVPRLHEASTRVRRAEVDRVFGEVASQ